MAGPTWEHLGLVLAKEALKPGNPWISQDETPTTGIGQRQQPTVYR